LIFSGVNNPIAILGAQHDSLSPPQLLKQFKEVLKAKPEVSWMLSSFVIIYCNFILAKWSGFVNYCNNYICVFDIILLQFIVGFF